MTTPLTETMVPRIDSSHTTMSQAVEFGAGIVAERNQVERPQRIVARRHAPPGRPPAGLLASGSLPVTAFPGPKAQWHLAKARRLQLRGQPRHGGQTLAPHSLLISRRRTVAITLNLFEKRCQPVSDAQRHATMPRATH